MERFDIAQVYALHNAPGVALGQFITCPGPIMAAVDSFHIDIRGLGGHGAMPHETRDPVVAALAIGQAIQTISSRNHYALDDLVISITQIHTGSAENIVPETAYLGGTVRTFDKEVQAMVRRRMEAIVQGTAAAFDVEAVLRYHVYYPSTVNHAAQTEFAVEVAAEVVGPDLVDGAASREMGAEDFSYMLEARPGAYLFLGQGEGAGLHQAGYDFNDEVAPIGASFFARLVERAQPVAG
jgi:hippurate hydrolase